MPVIAGIMLILERGEALATVRPPLDSVDTRLGLVKPDFSLPSEPKSLMSGISTVPSGEVTVGIPDAASLSSSMSTSPELARLGSSSPLMPRDSAASARLFELFIERDELKMELRDSATRSRDSVLMLVRFCISERLPFSSARFDLTSGLERAESYAEHDTSVSRLHGVAWTEG
jgi:hypothetical protein